MADLEGVQPSLRSAVESLMAACSGLTITSGYRSNDHQARLYQAAIAKYGSEAAARKWVAPPGHSNHNSGEAVDLGGNLACAHANAGRFGLSFPMGHEPWHVELSGTRGSASPDAYTTPPEQAADPLDTQVGNFLSALNSSEPDEEGGEETNEFGKSLDRLDKIRSTIGEQITAPTGMGGGGGADVDRLMNAIKMKESGGNYNASNPSGARGAYQILSSNYPSWAQEAGVSPNDWSPAAQDRVARYKLGQYLSQYGARGAAIAWYAGPGALKYSADRLNRPQGRYPSISSYADSILGMM